MCVANIYLWIPFCWLFDFSVNNLGNKIRLSQTPPNSSHCPINRLKLKVNKFRKIQTPHIFTAQIRKQINKEMKWNQYRPAQKLMNLQVIAAQDCTNRKVRSETTTHSRKLPGHKAQPLLSQRTTLLFTGPRTLTHTDTQRQTHTCRLNLGKSGDTAARRSLCLQCVCLCVCS